MTVIALPSGLAASQFSLRQATAQRASSSNFGGSEQVVDLLNDRWLVAFAYPNLSNANAARVEAFIAAMRSMTNTVALWHFRRPLPRGSMRGAPVVASTAAKGAAVLALTTTPNATLLAGDMIGSSGLLLQVADDCVANGAGAITVPLVNRLRKAIAVGSSVLWDKPTAPFRLISQVGVQYLPGYAPEVSLDFVEAVA